MMIKYLVYIIVKIEMFYNVKKILTMCIVVDLSIVIHFFKDNYITGNDNKLNK